MQLIDLYPTKGTFSPDETIRLVVEVLTAETTEGLIQLSVCHLLEDVHSFQYKIELAQGQNEVSIDFDFPSKSTRGYGVRAKLATGSGRVVDGIETAFDVLQTWADFPRYGFLTDFAPNRDDIDKTVSNQARFHINGLQFYDWQYRHDCLISPTERYIDPLGRELSLSTVRSFIKAAHQHGMRAMPYLAIYAASLEFWEEHPDWRLMDETGEPNLFEGFLGLMDPSSGSPWSEHLLEECKRVLDSLAFDGLHIDQYGDPKEGFTLQGGKVDLPSAFHNFIVSAKERFPRAALTFNAVDNWPIKALARAPLDFNYIEIWPSTPTFQDLRRIILDAREMSGDKPVVIALYLPADQEANIRLVDALVFASGGCRIEIGEGDRLLADPYFPKHQAIPERLKRILRRYYDFAVRYSEWIGPSASDKHELKVLAPTGVFSVAREVGGWLILHLINLIGLEDPRWDVLITPPSPLGEFEIEIAMVDKIKDIWWGSPDRDNLWLKPAEWRPEGERIIVELPRLEYWSMLAVNLDKTE